MCSGSLACTLSSPFGSFCICELISVDLHLKCIQPIQPNHLPALKLDPVLYICFPEFPALFPNLMVLLSLHSVWKHPSFVLQLCTIVHFNSSKPHNRSPFLVAGHVLSLLLGVALHSGLCTRSFILLSVPLE